MRITGSFVLLALLLSGIACATSGEPTQRRDTTVITRQEIVEMQGQVSNLYDLVQRLRPRWLDVRAPSSFSGSTEIVVYQDQSYLGDPSMLRGLGLDAAVYLSYLDQSQAMAQLPGLGSRRIAGAIVLHTREP